VQRSHVGFYALFWNARRAHSLLAGCSAISDEPDLDFAKRITAEYGVATIPVSPFYAKGCGDKVVRFYFGKTEDLLEEARRRLERV